MEKNWSDGSRVSNPTGQASPLLQEAQVSVMQGAHTKGAITCLFPVFLGDESSLFHQTAP